MFCRMEEEGWVGSVEVPVRGLNECFGVGVDGECVSERLVWGEGDRAVGWSRGGW